MPAASSLPRPLELFSARAAISRARAFYADVKGRLQSLGRPGEHMKVLPRAFVVVGDTAEEAREKRMRLDGLVHYDSAIASLSIMLGHDVSRFDPDGPLPSIPDSNASKSGRERIVELVQREKLRQNPQRKSRSNAAGKPLLSRTDRAFGTIGRTRIHDALSNVGGQGWNRTADTRIFSPLLYRLSYLPTDASCAELPLLPILDAACNRSPL